MAIRTGKGDCTVIGIDCAVDAKKVGLAKGVISLERPSSKMRIDEARTGNTWLEIVWQVAQWIEGDTLLALDTPLGWPQPLGRSLISHKAGAGLHEEADAMFRRLTDNVVRQRLGKQSLDVGADRIARTAHSALSFLKHLRQRTGHDVTMGWKPGTVSGVIAIEVYPAATLIGRGMPASNYKKNDDISIGLRKKMANGLAEDMRIEKSVMKRMILNNDVLDAVVCVVAGMDYATGRVIRPTEEDMSKAEQEGWIWVRDKP